MSISNPIDQLIHGLVQERAKTSQQRMNRLKAQRAEQRKADESHGKKQLEYLTAAGLNVKEMAQDLEEDGRKLKVLLDQLRPPLISRASLRAEDDKHAAHSSARLGGLGQMVVPYGGFYDPPDTSGEVLPVGPSMLKLRAFSTGHGWGWASAGANSPPNIPGQATAHAVFYFIPSQDGHYSITASLAFHGFYVLKADDGWFTTKHANITLAVSLSSYQFVDHGTKSFPALLDRNEQNVNEVDNFDQVLTFSDTQDFRQGEPVVVTASITAYAYAAGDGSFAEMNFSEGDANYIEPQWLWVTNLAGFGQ